MRTPPNSTGRKRSPAARFRARFYTFIGILTLGLIGTARAQSPAPRPPGLTHRWSFQETSGVTIHDSIGSAHGAIVTPNGGAPNATLGGGALRLGGGDPWTSSYAQFPAGLLSGLTDFTLEMWATPNPGIGYEARVFEFGDGRDGVSALFLSFVGGDPTGADPNLQRLGSVEIGIEQTAAYTTLGRRYHYVVTWDSANKRLSWYRDGQLIGGVATGEHILAGIPDDVFWLGYSHWMVWGDQTAAASYDEVRLWNYALSPDEISLHQLRGADGLAPVPSDIWAQNDSIQVRPGAGALIDVLSNDSNELRRGRVEITGSPLYGTAVVLPSGQIRYKHQGGATQTDTFTYSVWHWSGALAQARVSISPSSGRINATGLKLPAEAPAVGYQGVSAFPGLAFEEPVAIRSLTLPSGTSQLFVAERGGKIYRIPDVAATPPTKELFFDISQRSGAGHPDDANGECGLMSFAFHPKFAENGRFFVFYTPFDSDAERVQWDGANTLSEFAATGGLGGGFDPASATALYNNREIVLFSMSDTSPNHNAGDIHFGPNDGYLYISLGDGGNNYDMVVRNAQFLDRELFSGIARIDVDKNPGNLEPNPLRARASDGYTPGRSSRIPTYVSERYPHGAAAYSIPADNPFVGAHVFNGESVDPTEVRTEFWAVGLRSPWRMSFDPQNGDLWVGDVGQDAYEEVDLITKGGNYGWSFREGAHDYYGGKPQVWATSPPIEPVFEYSHEVGNSVIGGVVPHTSEQTPELNGAYVFGDFRYSTGSFWALRRIDGQVTAQRLFSGTPAVAFGLHPKTGDILYCHHVTGEIRRLIKANRGPSSAPAKLSETGIFSDTSTLTPNSGVTPYEVNVPFWSDHAIKQRWVAVPDGAGAFGFNANDPWTFPTGTTWVKHFDLAEDRLNPTGPRRRIETRVLVKTQTAAYGLSYRWNDAQTDADLVPESGATFDVSLREGGRAITQPYQIPGWSDCLSCHNQASGRGLSFNTAQLNRTSVFHGGLNQLDWLRNVGFLHDAPNTWDTAKLPRLCRADDTAASLTTRFKSYVAANCAQCHRPDNPMAYAAWDARYSTPLERMGLIRVDARVTGDGIAQLIAPGDPDRSVLLKHLTAVRGAPSVFKRMPPIGSYLNDTAAIDLVRNWISGIPREDGTSPWGYFAGSVPLQADGSLMVNAGGELSLTAHVNDSTAALQWFKNGVAIPKATGSTLSISGARASDAGTYRLMITPLSGRPTAVEVPVTVRDPFPLLRGQRGRISASVSLTPNGAVEQQPGLLTANITKGGAVSGVLKVSGTSYPFTGAFNRDWNLTWNMPAGFRESAIRLAVVWPSNSDTPRLTMAVGGTETYVNKEFRGTFGGAPLYNSGYSAVSGQSGFLSVTVNKSVGSASVVGALPNGERFSGSGFLMEADPADPANAGKAVVRVLSDSGATKGVYTQMELGTGQVSGSSRLAPFTSVNGAESPQTWAFNGAPFAMASTEQIFAPGVFSRAFENRYQVVVDRGAPGGVVAGTIQFEALRITTTGSTYLPNRGRPRIQFIPRIGGFFGTVGVVETDARGNPRVETRGFSGVVLGPTGGVGVTPQGVGIQIRHY